MNVIDEIKNWAINELLPWEADLVRRLIEGSGFSEQEIKECADLLGKHLRATIESEIQAVPPDKEKSEAKHKAPKPPVTLCSVSNPKNINALDPMSGLKLSHKGLTLFYGENGSGKSGYTRILKDACMAKHRDAKILNNVYEEANENPEQTAEIEYINHGERQVWRWNPGSKNEALSEINVYDVECGKVILDRDNKILYRPPGIEIFDGSPDILERIKSELLNRINPISKPEITDIENNPELKDWHSKLGIHTDIDELRKKLEWKKEEELETIAKLVSDYESGALIKEQKLLETITKEKLSRLISRLKSSALIFSEDKENELNALIQKKSELHKSHLLASKEHQFEAPLSGVFSPAWKELYLAAQEFSEKQAYVNTEFPNNELDARCVLCMSELDENAKLRMTKFSSFMKDKTKELYDNACKEYDNAVKAINDEKIVEEDIYAPLCQDIKALIKNDLGLRDAFHLIERRSNFFKQNEPPRVSRRLFGLSQAATLEA
ncbi:hypothetical protein ACS8E9_19365 [Pseudomonas neustonica]|uniref:hypothetical protein n=1 Tax=Pseudomonas neustonica TaxID=2487346 RepID=UPI003F478189